jgi:MOSC domain
MKELRGTVKAVACDSEHRFSKRLREVIDLVAGHGVEGDAHAGPHVRHRFLARRNPRSPNLRQVHLIPAELFGDLANFGYQISPGGLGENITTRGLQLERLPLATLLRLGRSAVVELTGLRTPCVLLDRFQTGLKKRMLNGDGPRYKCGVMGSCARGAPYIPATIFACLCRRALWRSCPLCNEAGLRAIVQAPAARCLYFAFGCPKLKSMS